MFSLERQFSEKMPKFHWHVPANVSCRVCCPIWARIATKGRAGLFFWCKFIHKKIHHRKTIPKKESFINKIWVYSQNVYMISTGVIHISTITIHILCGNVRSLQYIPLVFHNIHKWMLTIYPLPTVIIVVALDMCWCFLREQIQHAPHSNISSPSPLFTSFLILKILPIRSF